MNVTTTSGSVKPKPIMKKKRKKKKVKKEDDNIVSFSPLTIFLERAQA